MGRTVGSLNRTSVGLKLKATVPSPMARQSLNRTSVGLKQEVAQIDPFLVLEPQSNQRGIETKKGGTDVSLLLIASIEPAWD